MRSCIVLGILALLGAVGCEEGGVAGDDDDVEVVDDDDTADDDSSDDDTGDDDATGDDDTGDDDDTSVEDTMVFDIDGEWSGTALTLIWFEPGGMFDEDMSLLEQTVDGDPYGCNPGEPPADHLWEAAPGFRVAMYVPVLHEDLDGDGVRDPGEMIVGMGRAWPVWAEGAIPPDYTAQGVVEGWNAIEMDWEEDGEFAVHDVMGIPLGANLWPVESLQLGGQYVGDLAVETQRLAVAPITMFEGQPVSSLMYDEPLALSWTIDLSGEPPADHQVYDPHSGLNMAWEIPLAYLDNDGSGGLSGGDEPTYMVCYDGATVVVFWGDAAMELEVAWYYEFALAAFGGGPGLFVAAMDPEAGEDDPPIQIDPADLLSLEVSGNCSLE